MDTIHWAAENFHWEDQLGKRNSTVSLLWTMSAVGSGISRNLKSMWRNAGESHNFIYTRYCVDEMCPPTTDTNARLWHSNDLAIQWSAFYSLEYCTFLLMIRKWRLAEVVKLIIMWIILLASMTNWLDWSLQSTQQTNQLDKVRLLEVGIQSSTVRWQCKPCMNSCKKLLLLIDWIDYQYLGYPMFFRLTFLDVLIREKP